MVRSVAHTPSRPQHAKEKQAYHNLVVHAPMLAAKAYKKRVETRNRAIKVWATPRTSDAEIAKLTDKNLPVEEQWDEEMVENDPLDQGMFNMYRIQTKYKQEGQEHGKDWETTDGFKRVRGMAADVSMLSFFVMHSATARSHLAPPLLCAARAPGVLCRNETRLANRGPRSAAGPLGFD